MEEQAINWADVAAQKIIKENGNKKKYVCASGISPSGHIHIGNFREVITTALVVKSLREKGKDVRFIYSWDEFDALRKIPKDFPKEYEQYLGMPLCKVPDLKKCHKSYAAHFEKEMEDSIVDMDLGIEYLYQGKLYQSCVYAEKIKEALVNREKARKILNKYRKEPLPDDWIPLEVFCEKCWKNITNILAYDEKYEVHYECKCGHSNKIDFRKVGNVKLSWRIDWPARQEFEKVDFEPAGKDHYAAGGSRPTANEIIEAVWKRNHVTDLPYEWIAIKGGGEFASSKGVVTLPKEVLEIYEPDVLQFLFTGTQPNKTFDISFDLDVLKIYEDFDRYERAYFGKEELSEKEAKKLKRVYELSCIHIPKKLEEQPTFRHLTMLLQIHEGDVKKAIKDIKSERVVARAKCAWNWLQKYAPDDFKFSVHEKITKEVNEHLSDKQKKSLQVLQKVLGKKKFDEQGLFDEFYVICKEIGFKNTEFFEGAYLALIGKKRGPKLASFILALGQKRIATLLEGVK
tara:strand:+ start:48479 stop:50023 length:1545 start_codon:yes stop_codon:yes gene_type:complete